MLGMNAAGARSDSGLGTTRYGPETPADATGSTTSAGSTAGPGTSEPTTSVTRSGSIVSGTG